MFKFFSGGVRDFNNFWKERQGAQVFGGGVRDFNNFFGVKDLATWNVG